MPALFTDLSAYYDDPAAQLPPLETTFRDYVLAESSTRNNRAHQESEKYWLDRVTTLPPMATSHDLRRER